MVPKLLDGKNALPIHKELFYNGEWHMPINEGRMEVFNPGNGKSLSRVSQAGVADVDAAVETAHQAFLEWRSTPPPQRAICLRRAADAIREHTEELALLDSLNTGNPVVEMLGDARVAAEHLDFFAGLIPMVKGETIPQSGETFHYTVRELLGVVVRIIAFNHPVLFAGAKMAAPIAAGNTVIIKPPDQAPLSCLRLVEILQDIFPPGVLSLLPGGAECGRALSRHPLVRSVALIGSVHTAKAIHHAASGTLKATHFELGGKNALLAFPDADIGNLVEGVARGMNFSWAGQSCGSTSRIFLHESHHDEVVERVVDYVKCHFKPGIPTDVSTTMGPVISEAARDRVLAYIESAKKEGATLVLGGKVPSGIPEIEGGYFIEPTIFTNVRPEMRIAMEEVFGPVMSVFKWTEEDDLIKQANATEYGLTASIYTQNMSTAHRVVQKIEAGFIWVNQVGRHFLGVPFGGVKASGMGRDECLEEMLSFTQTKSVSISLV
ncbi:aldehyde dehydrogenase domain-containing protein [Aspergillus granulosus]|uniref:aldehyde dehydrogenase (NAD(+)) n=1 Tax=Aspergillus granulosus TaxID=176169 RepID=A0ABR4I3V6_9EURO